MGGCGGLAAEVAFEQPAAVSSEVMMRQAMIGLIVLSEAKFRMFAADISTSPLECDSVLFEATYPSSAMYERIQLAKGQGGPHVIENRTGFDRPPVVDVRGLTPAFWQLPTYRLWPSARPTRSPRQLGGKMIAIRIVIAGTAGTYDSNRVRVQVGINENPMPTAHNPTATPNGVIKPTEGRAPNAMPTKPTNHEAAERSGSRR